MQAKSFLSEMREEVRLFYATVMRHEVNDANVRGYLRAASQIEDIWQQIDEKLALLLSQGTLPWEAYAQLKYPLAYIRIARTYQMLVKELLAADAAFAPETAGYLPQVTYDQANVWCHQIYPCLQQAIATLHESNEVSDVVLPLMLEPRKENQGSPCPVTHLQGMIAAAREIREWAAGLIAQYTLAVNATHHPLPTEISAHVMLLESQLAQADMQLRFGIDLAGQVSQGQATPQLHEDTEERLWEALQHFFVLNQAIAQPGMLQHNRPRAAMPHQTTQGHVYRDLPIHSQDLWRVAASSACSELRGTKFGTKEMEELCEKMGNVLSAGAQRYLDEVEAAVVRGNIFVNGAMANCPFEPLYRTRRSLVIAGTRVPADYEFHWNFHRGHIEFKKRFARVPEWKECDE
jgi:hypothetical protein